MDKKIQALLKLGVPYDQKELEPKPEDTGPVVSGVGSISLDDLSVSFELNVLRDHLTLVGDPDDIIRMYRDHPDRLNAVRTTGAKCSSGCDKCESDTRDSREKEQDEEDK